MQLLLSNVQECLRALELHEEAIKLTSEAYKDIAQKLGINSPEALDQIQIQASLHVKINQMENAETLYQQCLVGHEQSLGLNHSVTLNTAYLLADVLTRQGRHGEAIPLRRRHLEGQRKQNMDRNEETMTAAVELAIDLFKEGQYEEAEINLKCVLTVLEGLDAPSEPELWFVLSMLSQVLDNNDRVEEAIKFTRRTIQCLTDDEDPDRQLVNHERVVLSRQLAEIGNIEEAIQQLQEVISTLSNNPKAVDEDLELLNDAEELRRQIAEEA
ncbi:tetratricopeptide repeat protein [Cyanobium sp. FGCU-52]|nr:tetratricopeptide repeat protein [Cyanobium sp. FGCU52]